MYRLSGIALVAFLIAAVIAPIAIPILRRLKFGQEIREIGPSWHKGKSGTPTMGGIIFIIGAILTAIILVPKDGTAILILSCSFAFGIIGLLDDFIKVVLKRNLGLRAWQKFSLQVMAAVLFVVIGLNIGVLSNVIMFPFVGMLDVGIFYLPLAVFIMLAATNSVNLTDGIDGLATSVTAVVVLFFTVIMVGSGQEISAAILGAMLGFLVYNRHPAKVFMGDTGSLFLGGAVAALALVAQNPLILILIGVVYIVETLSVIIQVTYFKFTKKRVFKMSPIHHHFEMCGWSEGKIVAVFAGVTAVMCTVAWFIL